MLVGSLFAKDYNTLTASTTHGIRSKRFSVGIGIGYDVYQDWETMPIFIATTFDFFKLKNSAFFILARGGYAKAWQTSKLEYEPTYNADDGFMMGSSMGYRIKANNASIYFCAGYNFQRVSYNYNTPDYWYANVRQSNSIAIPSTHVQRDMQRFVLQIGVGLH